MSVFFTDEIDIINVTYDDDGVSTEVVNSGLKARVEDFNELIINEKGQEVFGEMIIFTKGTEPITENAFVKIIKKNGVSYENPNKKWKVLKTPIIHGFRRHHREIYV